ncbi:MAG: hypothetical protein ACXU8U_03245 [Asticcacaulis sp.]
MALFWLAAHREAARPRQPDFGDARRDMVTSTLRCLVAETFQARMARADIASVLHRLFREIVS